MTAEDLARVGEILFGPCWRTPLGVALGVSDRTIRRWLGGQPIPAGLSADIARVAGDRLAEIEPLAQNNERHEQPKR